MAMEKSLISVRTGVMEIKKKKANPLVCRSDSHYWKLGLKNTFVQEMELIRINDFWGEGSKDLETLCDTMDWSNDDADSNF